MTRQVLFAALALAGLVAAAALAPPHWMRDTDYMEYAAAARLFLARHNPYDWAALLEIQRAHGSAWSHAGMMWNPPSTLPIIAPLGVLPWRTGQAVWVWVNLMAVAFAGRLLWRGAGGEPGHAGWGVLLAFAFAPVIAIVQYGQITGLPLLGLAGFAAARRANRPVLGGLALLLTATKPHLLLPFALLLGLDALTNRATRRLVACGVGWLLAAATVAELVVPGVWADYRAATQAPGDALHIALSEWHPPTLAFELRATVGGPLFVQFALAMVAAVLLAGHWWRRRDRWDWDRELPLVALASLVTTGYGAWSHDVALTLPAVLAAAVCVRRSAGERGRFWLFGLYLAVNALAVKQILPIILWAPTVAAGYALALAWLPRRQPDSATPPAGAG